MMPLTSQLVRALTPPIGPPAAPGTDGGFAEGNPRSRRLAWTAYLRNGPFARVLDIVFQNIDSAWYAGVGLVPVAGLNLDISGDGAFRDAVLESGYVWGGVIFTSAGGHIVPAIVTSTLNFDAGTFPIIVRPVSNRPQTLEVKVGGSSLGTAACFAERHNDAFPSAGKKGVLTASHVAGSMLSGFDIHSGLNSTPAQVGVHSPPSLDSVFLEANWALGTPTRFAPLSNQSIAAGDQTDFSGASTAHRTGFVTHFAPHPSYLGSGIAMHLCHDGLGAAGDSGAMVKVQKKNAAMHISQIALNSGGAESLTILLEQVAHVMKIDLYE